MRARVSRFVPVPEQVLAELGLDIPAELLNTLPAPGPGAVTPAPEPADQAHVVDLDAHIDEETMEQREQGSPPLTSTGWAGKRSSSAHPPPRRAIALPRTDNCHDGAASSLAVE